MNSIPSLTKLFAYYKELGEKAIAQVGDADLHRAIGEEGNSIAVVMRHIAGNAKSRFSDFLTSDGEKPWRDREDEFTEGAASRAQLLQEWGDGWACLFSAISHLSDADLDRMVLIRNEGHTVLEALHRQLAHYAYHVGQIVLLSRAFVGPAWISLSIPRGKSRDYNAEKFGKPAGRRHFTDEDPGN